jgi:hypothetical protein
MIYTTYHLTRILVYRTFIPSPKADDSCETRHTDLPFPAASICVDSAKSLAEIADYQLKHGLTNSLCMFAAAHHGAALLLAHVWCLKHKERTQMEGQQDDIKPPLAHTIEDIMGHIAVFTRVLELAAPRWQMAAQSL